MDGSVYDVFISFRGIDTRSRFTGYLHRDLCGKQVKSFMDDQNLEKGAEINPALDKAIQTSRIALVILSKNYASSTFCLDELEKIMDCSKDKGMLVLPVFYEVEPSDVRYQKGEYANALKKHEARFIDEKDKIEKWRVALTKISDLSGWNSKDFSPEYKLIDTIVEHITKRIHKLRDDEKEKIICNVDAKHVTKHNNVENLVTDPTPQKSLIEEINDMSISGILNYDSRKMIAAAVLIQRKFHRRRLYRERQAIKIQAAFRRYQAWKQYRKMIWSVEVLGKAILHWRPTTRGFCVLEHGHKTEEELFLQGRKQAENRAERYVACVNAVSSSEKSEEGYSRMKLAQPPNSADSGMVPQAGSPRSSSRPGQVPRGASVAQCFKAGLNHLELKHLSVALSCFDESFRSLAKEQSLGNDIKAQATICGQYKIAVTLLKKIGNLQRVDHDPSTKDEVARLSRHLGSLPLQPKHRTISIQTAIKRNMEVQNYAYSKQMLELLLSKTAQSKQDEIWSQIELCIQRGLKNKSIDPLEDPSQFCAATLSRLSSTIGYDVCDVCGSKFSAVNATGCIICGIGSMKR